MDHFGTVRSLVQKWVFSKSPQEPFLRNRPIVGFFQGFRNKLEVFDTFSIRICEILTQSD
jgi:hypothetical protein